MAQVVKVLLGIYTENNAIIKLMSKVFMTKDTFKQMHRHEQCRHMRG